MLQNPKGFPFLARQFGPTFSADLCRSRLVLTLSGEPTWPFPACFRYCEGSTFAGFEPVAGPDLCRLPLVS